MSGRRPRLRLIVITGPTATGKTALGVEVAHALGSEIVSADSRQVYRGLDLGSGKDLGEYGRVDPPVPYHLIDVVDPTEVYSLYRYQRDCYRVLADAARRAPFDRGVPLVMVGGSGLYVEAVLRGYRIANVPEDVALRTSLMRREREDLVRELRAEAPELADRTDLRSRKRVVRALEIVAHARTATVEYSEAPPIDLDWSLFVVDVPREVLHRRIDARLDARLEAGLIDEVRGLLDAGVGHERMRQLGLEYREVAAFIAGEKDRETMVADLRRGIRKLAKRQRTWFRGFERRGLPARTIAPEPDLILGAPGVKS